MELKKIGKKIKVSLVLIMVFFLLVACGSNNSKSDSDDVLTFYSWDDKKIFEPVIKSFNEKYPDVKIEFSHKPPVDEYIQGLQTNLLSDTAADVFIMGAENKSNLINNENVKNLNNLDAISNLNETNKELYGKNGNVYAASISSWGGGIAYNKKILKQVGYDEFPKTWDGFIQLCIELKEKEITPYFEGAQSGNFMTLYALIGGQYEVNGGNKDSEIFSGESSFSKEYSVALDMWNMLLENKLMTSDVLGLTDDQIMNEFANENVAMVGMGPWNVATIRESNPDLEFSIAPVPGKKEGQEYATGAPSPGYAININAKNKKMAEEFVSFMTTPEAAKAYNGEGFSNNMYTTKGTEDINSTLDDALLDINRVVQEGKIYLPVMSWESHQDQLTTTFRSSLQELIQGNKDTKKVLLELDNKLAEVQE